MELNDKHRPTDAALCFAGSPRAGSAFQDTDTLTPERPRLTKRAIGGWGGGNAPKIGLRVNFCHDVPRIFSIFDLAPACLFEKSSWCKMQAKASIGKSYIPLFFRYPKGLDDYVFRSNLLFRLVYKQLKQTAVQAKTII